MLPLAPALFSTTTACPHFSESFGPITRARMSIPVPGEKGTTSVTGRLGNGCAIALAATRSSVKSERRMTGVPASAKIKMVTVTILDLENGDCHHFSENRDCPYFSLTPCL